MIPEFLSLIFFVFDFLDPELDELDELEDPEEEFPDEEVESEFCPPPLPSASAMTSKIVNPNASKLQNT